MSWDPWAAAFEDGGYAPVNAAPNRGPLLIVEGEKDSTVPVAIADATFRRQRRNAGFTDINKMAGRGHAPVIDSGWKDVATLALEFVRKYAR